MLCSGGWWLLLWRRTIAKWCMCFREFIPHRPQVVVLRRGYRVYSIWGGLRICYWWEVPCHPLNLWWSTNKPKQWWSNRPTTTWISVHFTWHSKAAALLSSSSVGVTPRCLTVNYQVVCVHDNTATALSDPQFGLLVPTHHLDPRNEFYYSAKNVVTQ